MVGDSEIQTGVIEGLNFADVPRPVSEMSLRGRQLSGEGRAASVQLDDLVRAVTRVHSALECFTDSCQQRLGHGWRLERRRLARNQARTQPLRSLLHSPTH